MQCGVFYVSLPSQVSPTEVVFMADIYDEYQSLSPEEEYGDSYSRPVHSRRRKKKKHIFRKILSLLFVFLIAVAVWLFMTVCSVISSVNYEEIDSKYADVTYSSNLVSDDDVFNILIFGVDENTSDYGRSDSMILLSVNDTTKKIKLTSFQRDTFVFVPDPDGSYNTKLTNAYSYGGVGLTISTIEENYGIKIDRYASVNFETFVGIVDTLGGVEMELTDREILYINCQIAQNNQMDYLDAQAGKVLLSGTQALWHARNRGGDVINGVEFYEGTDWDRTLRQRNFLEAVFHKLKDASVFELVSVLKKVAPYITTNMTESEISSFIMKSPKYLRYTVEQTSAPADGCWGYELNFAGDVIYVYDWDLAKSELRNFIYEDYLY